MPIERDMNSINQTLEDPKHQELASAISTKLNYVIDQNKRTRNREKLVKTTTYEILRLMYEYDAMIEGRQIIQDHMMEDVRDIQEELNKGRGDAPF